VEAPRPDLFIVRPLDETGPRWSPRARAAGQVAAVAAGAIGLAAAVITETGIFGAVVAGVAFFAARSAAIRRVTRAQLGAGRVRDDFAALDAVPDRTVVRLRGRVRGAAKVEALLSPAYAVARRVIVTLDTGGKRYHFVHEAAHDFALVDGNGREVLLHVAGAEMLAPIANPGRVEAGTEPRLRALPLPEDLRGARLISASEQLVMDDEPLEVVGVKSRAAAPGAALGRETPWRTVITSGPLPMVLFL
jgi:hypothetical protein